MRIQIDDLRGPEIAALLQEHLAHMAAVSPAASMHALDLAALQRPEMTFWTAWDGAQLAGCCALKRLSAQHVELKSMRTAAGSLRRGVASALLAHVLAVAKTRGYQSVCLETGAQADFVPARTMYARFGFVACGPFGDYVSDPHSVFMAKTL